MKLLDVQDVGPAFARAGDYMKDHIPMRTESLPLQEALGRFLAGDVVAKEDLPNFTRSTVDGYAVRTKDVGGATEAIPSFLEVLGEVAMGEATSLVLSPGTCAYVPTGGMIPQGADAMVMIEVTEKIVDQVAVYRPAAFGDGILRAGSDLAQGDLVLRKGTRLHAYDIASLAAIGQAQVDVFARPRVWVFSSGDEVVPVTQDLGLGQVRDSNGAGVRALAESYGWTCVGQGHLADDDKVIAEALDRACSEADLVVVSGGSSKGSRDYTARAFASLGEPGVFTHGIAMKPGKPTILAGARQTLLVGLPGHPVSALLVWDQVLQALGQALYAAEPALREYGQLGENLPGTPGQARVIPARMYEEEGRTVLVPLPGRSGQVSLLSRAQALIFLDKGAEGVPAGGRVPIRRLRT